MTRKPIKLKDPDAFTLEELGTLSATTMTKVLRDMSQEHKQELLAECVYLIEEATKAGTSVGQAWTDTKEPSRFPTPYGAVKKFSYLYTCISGWMSNADLEEREQEKFRCEVVTEVELQKLAEHFNKRR